jgi:hypothetical protein
MPNVMVDSVDFDLAMRMKKLPIHVHLMDGPLNVVMPAPISDDSLDEIDVLGSGR